MGKRITIHQPDFLPWLGLYNKISKVDELVVLDHVANNPRDSAFWCRRVQMLIGGSPSWISVPLIKPKGIINLPINQMEVNLAESKQIRKTLESIRINYARAPFFSQAFELVSEYFESTEKNLFSRNFHFLKRTMELMNIKPAIILSSTLDCSQSSTSLLVEILKKRNGTHYICGAGAAGYQKDELLVDAGIEVSYNSFHHPLYKQFNSNTFHKGLSVVDAIMNMGLKATEKIIKTPE